MLIDWLVRKESSHIPGLLPIINNLDGLIALLKTVFEPVVTICRSIKNEYQHRYNEHLQSMKNMDSTKEILIVERAAIVPQE